MKTKTTPESSKHRGATAGGHSTPGLAGTLAPEIRPEQSIELLKALHILTREGKLNQDSRRKLKQVYHLYQFIEKLLLELPATGHGITLADHGAGKSYLGFILYDLFFKEHSSARAAHIYGIETRPELVKKSQELAHTLGFDRMSFLNLRVAESAHAAALPERDCVWFAQGRTLHGFGAVLPGGNCPLPESKQSTVLVAHALGGVVAPSVAYARNGEPNYQCAALSVP